MSVDGRSRKYIIGVDITDFPTNTGTLAVLDEMEAFTLTPNGKIELSLHMLAEQDTADMYFRGYAKFNGVGSLSDEGAFYRTGTVAGGPEGVNAKALFKVLCGLNKFEFWWQSQDATTTSLGREFILEEN